MNRILRRAIVKARKSGLLRLVPAAGPVRLDCLAEKCAKCCTNLGTPAVTPAEAEKIGYKFIQKDKNRMYVRSKDGLCCLLKNGLCSRYWCRPRGCREYPWYNINGRLYYDSGCPGIKHDKDQRPDISDIQPFENYFPLSAAELLSDTSPE